MYTIAPAQQNIADSLLHQGYQRQYMVHLPPGFSTDTVNPAVFTLHGGRGNYLRIQGFTQMNRVANQHGFIAVYPQGIGSVPPGYSWADGRGTTADQAGIDDVGFLSELIDKLAADFAIDTNRVYVCGFSNGGFMTQRLACALSDKFAAFGGLGCSMDTALYVSCNPSRPLPMMYVAGTEDPEVPYEGGRMTNPAVNPIVPVDSAVQFWVNHNNCSNPQPEIDIPNTVQDDHSTVKLYNYTGCDANAHVRFFKVLNGGHTWPGVVVPNMEDLLGETNEDMHASVQLWQFFKQYRLDSTATGITKNPQSTTSVRIYPNPATDVVHVKTTRPLNALLLFSQSGQRVFRKPAKGFCARLSVADLKPGMYYLLIRMNDGQRIIRKLIK